MSFVMNKWWALSGAVLLAGASGCKTMGGGSDRSASTDPAARQIAASQEASEKAIEQARDAQKKASDQARRAADAQREVQEAQQRLTQAQERSRQEQEKAQQLQREANEATERATAEAQRAQREASQALARQSARAERGEQMLSGQVIQATDEQLVVRPTTGGDTMTFRVTDETRIDISGRKGSASELRQGEDARVSYEVSGTEPRAVSIQVMRSEQPSDRPSGAAEPRTTEPRTGEPATEPLGPERR